MAQEETFSLVKPVVVCGPSAVGKKTLIRRLIEKIPNTFELSVSHTTRDIGDHEQNSVSYHFVSNEEFEKGIKNNEFLEFNKILNNYYGTSKQSVKRAIEKKLIIFIVVDTTGASNIKKLNDVDCNFLFFTTSNLKNIEKRLKTQNDSINQEQIKQKLEISNKEIAFLNDNANFFDSVICNNNDMDEAFDQLIETVLDWYPSLRAKPLQTNSFRRSKIDLHDASKVNNAAKRQSGDFFNDIQKFATQENKMSDLLTEIVDSVVHSDANVKIVQLIVEFTNVAPINRRSVWKANEYSAVISKLRDVASRWTIGHNIEYFPNINTDTIGNIYFANHTDIMIGTLYQLCGTVRDKEFTKRYYGIDTDEFKDEQCDECLDVYFYMKCDTEFRGSVQFSLQWNNMAMFGLDSDAIRQATETGNWRSVGLLQMPGVLIEDLSDAASVNND